MADAPPIPGQQQAPFGQSNATSPSPNLGYEAAGLQKLGSIIKQLEQVIPLLGATTDGGKAALDALNKLVKFVPPGSVSPASDRNNLEQALMTNVQNNAQVQALRARGTQGMEPPPPPAMPKVA